MVTMLSLLTLITFFCKSMQEGGKAHQWSQRKLWSQWWSHHHRLWSFPSGRRHFHHSSICPITWNICHHHPDNRQRKTNQCLHLPWQRSRNIPSQSKTPTVTGYKHGGTGPNKEKSDGSRRINTHLLRKHPCQIHRQREIHYSEIIRLPKRRQDIL